MYAICICEKDFTYLNSLRSAIPWNELGYSLMESFTSADQAIIYLQSSPPDAFICGMECGGLTIAKYVYDNRLPTNVVLIGSMPSFGDLRMALRYRAVDFILSNPLNVQELTHRLSALKRRLDWENLALSSNARFQSTLESIYHIFTNPEVSSEHLLLFPVSCIGDIPGRRMLEQLMKSAFSDEPLENTLHWREGEEDQFFLCVKSSMGIEEIKQTVQKHLVLAGNAFGIALRLSGPVADLSGSIQVARAPAPAPEEQTIVAQVEAFIRQNIAKKITLDMVSKHVHVNPSYLSRYFKRKKGVSFSDFLLQTRIEYAKKLLLDPNKYIKEVCEEVGITNYQYFYLCFRKLTGLSPTEYRAGLGIGFAPVEPPDPPK